MPVEVWDYDLAVDYMERIGRQPRDLAESEVLRYLGWPGQAISYKVGEREILDIRKQAMAGAGASFDGKDFHRRLLDAGAIRLDHLRERWPELQAGQQPFDTSVGWGFIAPPSPYIPKWRWGFAPRALPEVPT